jgi:hypothetical protein
VKHGARIVEAAVDQAVVIVEVVLGVVLPFIAQGGVAVVAADLVSLLRLRDGEGVFPDLFAVEVKLEGVVLGERGMRSKNGKQECGQAEKHVASWCERWCG